MAYSCWVIQESLIKEQKSSEFGENCKGQLLFLDLGQQGAFLWVRVRRRE